jgi:uncharacterized protein DUF6916
MHLGDLTIEFAQTLVGTTFEVTLGDGGTTAMKLEAAAPYEVQRRGGRRATTPKRTPFSLYFLGDPTLVVPQGMYAFRSATVSFENLFIVPISQDAEATEYEAVFN